MRHDVSYPQPSHHKLFGRRVGSNVLDQGAIGATHRARTDDQFLVDRVTEVLGGAGHVLESRARRFGWLIEATDDSAGEHVIAAVVMHRDLVREAVRADISIRSESIELLPCLAEAAAAGHRTTITWETIQSSETITPEELRLLGYLASGHSNQAIARTVGLSKRQVQRQLTDLYGLLGATDRSEAVALAARMAGDPAGRA